MTCRRAQEIDLAAFVLDAGDPEWSDFRGHYPGCSDCAREVATWTRLEGALRETGVDVSAHPSDALLATFADTPGDLSGAERQRLTRHVGGCAECGAAVALLHGYRVESPEAEPASLGQRLLDRLRSLLPDGAIPAPALALALLLVLLVPAALWMWQTRGLAPSRELPSPPIAEQQPQTELPTQVAQQPAPPAHPKRETPPPPGPEVTPPEAPPKLAQRPPEPIPPPEPEPTPQSPEAPLLIAANLPSTPPLYPGMPGSEVVRTAGIVRSGRAPRVFALAPEHVGRALSESPTLYWYFDRATESSVRVIVIATTEEDPAFEVELPGPWSAGIHALPLSEAGVRLQPDTVYQWSVALIVDPDRPTRDVTSDAALQVVSADPALASRLAGVRPSELAHARAAEGLWYDAFDLLSRWLEREPDSRRLRLYRVALLEQVGLGEVAQAEAQAAGR